MGARFSRLVSVAAAGGVLTGSLLLGGGVALAAPADDDVVEATCGETVTARPGDTVEVDRGLLGTTRIDITGAMKPLQPLAGLLGGALCDVQVRVIKPVTEGLGAVAPPLAPVTGAVEGATGALLAPQSQEAAAPETAPSSRAVAPAPAAAPVLPPAAAAAAAPAFAPTFRAGLPASFLAGAAPVASAPAGLRSYDAGALFGSAFPGLRAGAPAYLGYDPASSVTTASQVQALPVDGMSRGMGVPVMLAVLALAGVAAFVVRAMVLRRAATASPTTAGRAGGETVTADGDTELVGTAGR